VRDDSWLAERLGRAALWWEDGDDPEWVAASARERAPALAQARVACDRVEAIIALQDAGFRVVDATVRVAGPAPRPRGGGAVTVRDAEPADAAALLDIAEHHYGVSRFHLDPAISDAVAGALKRDWLQAYFEGTRGDRLLTAVRDGRPVGFLALIRRGDVGVIDLIAVHPTDRGAGAGAALVGALGASCARVEAGTQLANYGALRFYGRLGFGVAAGAHVLHLHA
jgi:ribosomal protein S18 acetylase RimI-like enzyme